LFIDCRRVNFNTPLERRVLNHSIFILASVLASSSTVTAEAQEASTLFNEKCSGCHSIGGGNLVGPDLADSAKWKTEDLRSAIKRMEENTGPLPDAEVSALVDFLKNSKAAKKTETSGQSESKTSPEKPVYDGKGTSQETIAPATEANASVSQKPLLVEPGSIEKGRRLFNGELAFKNGGSSCIACHSIHGNGGNLAPDLATVAQKMPPAALISACEKTPYKVMKAAYREHPVVHQEAVDLTAYLGSLNTDPPGKQKTAPVALIAISLAGLTFAGIAFGYRNRKKSARSMLKRRD